MSEAQEQQRILTRSRPLISIVIPVFDIEDYLAECLNSITGQTFRDIEIIAVDGASRDSSGTILDQMSGEDARLTVVHTDQKIGPGRARNLGAGRARGEYIWFVDGDDAIAPGCLSGIAGRIEAVQPDVLFIGYEDLYPDGRSEPGYGYDFMGRGAGRCFTLAEQPWVAGLSMASWNKVIRREFFLATSAAFWDDPPHEDVPVSCLLMVEAEKLSVLDSVCYSYRKNRSGSAMSSGPTKRHFNILRSYGAVLDQIVKRAGNGDEKITGEVRHALFQRAIRHYAAILDTSGPGIGPIGADGLIARRDRREFFHRMHWDYLHYRPPGYKRVKGLRGIKFLLIERDDYWIYCLLEPVNWVRGRLRLGASRMGRRLRQRRG